MKRYHILLFLLFTLVNVVAQDLRKFSIVSFEEKPFDLAATDTRYKIEDGNGALFSIIKLVAATPDDDLTAYHFDFGLCEDREKTVNGERWIYVQRNAMHVAITREGFQPVKSELNLTVQEGKVYEMVLQAAPKVIKRQFLVFEVSPVDSEAIITYKKANVSGEFKPFGNGKVDNGGRSAKSLELGVYTYKIISTNYHVSEGIVKLDSPNEKHVEKVELRPNFANVTLNTADGVDIYIDEEKKATGTWSGKLSPGTYSVECRKELHKSSFETITVEEGEDFTLQLKAPTPITGVLSISSNPLGARISVDGKKYGETPDFIEDLLIGEHKVELACNGYKSESITVVIKENEVTEHSVELVAVAKQVASSLRDINGEHEAVDLGLSVKWATCNVGATSPEDYGDYYAWGEVETKNNYSSRTYNVNGINGDISGNAQYDVARAKWGGSWRIPTKAEIQELKDKCTWKWTTQKGVSGYKVTSKKNGNSIFLPAAGYCGVVSGTGLSYRDNNGYYWSSSLYDYNDGYAHYLLFYDDYYLCSFNYRYYGQSVRPVMDSKSESKSSSSSKADASSDKASLFKDTSLYFGSGVRVTSTNSWMLYYGGYLRNVNCELFFFQGWDKVPFFLESGTNNSYPGYASVKAAGGFKLGYGIKAGKRLRFTPQLGTTFMAIIGDVDLDGEHFNLVATYPVLLDFGVKCDFALGKMWGITVTPEYSYAVKKNGLYKKFESFSTKARGWGNGFNVGLGLYLSF